MSKNSPRGNFNVRKQIMTDKFQALKSRILNTKSKPRQKQE